MKKSTYSKKLSWLDEIFKRLENLPYQGHFDIQQLRINVHAYDPETFHWVSKYLDPLHLSITPDTPLAYTVNMLHSDELVHSVLRSIDASEVDTDGTSNARRSLLRIPISEEITVDCDPTYGMLWVTDRSRKTITIVLSVKVRWPLLEISRVVRDLITQNLEDQGWVLFHAGAIQTNHKNYMIIGDASAGKTSLIIALLSSGSGYISNERVFAKAVDGEVRMLSFPMPIAVGLGTMMQYPELIKYIRQPQFCQYPPRRMNISRIHDTPEQYWPRLEDKVQFLPPELFSRFSDRPGIPGGTVDGVIVPFFRKNRSVEIKPLSQEYIQQVIKNNCINRDHDGIYPPWMPLPFQRPGLGEIKNTISCLTDLPSVRFKFSADRNKRNETSTYPTLLSETFTQSLGL